MNSPSSKSWKGGPSPIHGQGAFAQESIGDGEYVDHLITRLNAGGLMGGDRTPLGDHINHQSKPNGRMVQVPSTDQYYFQSSGEIAPGDELTMDYNDTPSFVAKPHQIDPENYQNWK